MNYEKYEADREAAAAAFEEVKAVFSERITPFISSIYAVVSERIPQFIISVMEFITACAYGFTAGIQQAKLEQIERVFAPYEIKREIHAPQYKPLADVVAAFNYSKYLYEYYND